MGEIHFLAHELLDRIRDRGHLHMLVGSDQRHWVVPIVSRIFLGSRGPDQELSSDECTCRYKKAGCEPFGCKWLQQRFPACPIMTHRWPPHWLQVHSKHRTSCLPSCAT